VLLLGLVLNVSGLAKLFMATSVYPAYEALANTATSPIAPLILFTLGYSFSIGRDNLGAILKTLAIRLVLMVLGVVLAFVLFPWILQDEALKIAVMLFLMCPPAFAAPIILEKVYRREADSSFCSTYISVHMLATVIIFALMAVLV
jgi:predicted permease